MRLRLERALARADPHPSEMAPQAVLLVRRLSAPAPDGSSAWGRVLNARLNELIRSAARPARGDAAHNAPAVLFADAVELLACLASDMAIGVASECWWWHAYLRGQAATRARLPVVLGADLRILPATIDLLVATGRARAVLLALAPGTARDLALAMVRCYGASNLRVLLDRSYEQMGAETPSEQLVAEPRPPRIVHALSMISQQRSPRKPPIRAMPATAPAPWAGLISFKALPTMPTREHALLLGLSLVLHAHPARVRATAFQRSLAAWWKADDPAPPRQEREQPPEHFPVRAMLVQTHDPRPAPPRPRSRTSNMPIPNTRFGRHRHVISPVDGSDTVPRSPLERVEVAGIEHHGPRPRGMPEGTQAPPPEEGMAHAGAGSGALTPIAAATTATEMPVVDALLPRPTMEEGVVTELGGVFYLINLMLYLHLPECFEPGWRLLSAVGPWRVLALLARQLLDHPQDWDSDPIWSALASLAGRAPVAGGRRTTPRYRIPARWLVQLPGDPDERFFFATSRRRLLVWSSRGFVLYDGPARHAEAAAHTILTGLHLDSEHLTPADAADAPLAVLSRDSPPDIVARARTWLRYTLPYLRLRLALALGLHDVPGALDRALLRRHGRLYVSATHVDLVLGLSSVTLPVRLAGLDRSPGWIAEYGHAIVIDFEEDADGVAAS